MRKLLLILTLISYVIFGSCPALADVNSSMGSFFSNSMSSTNGTGPRAYQGQSAGFYTLGDYSYRTPIENVNVVSASLPSVKAGCGGIDIFGGNFSMINAAQLVTLFKAVAQNAVGLLFQMAVKTLSELLGNEIEEMFQIIQKANLGAQNSCELAQMGINTAVGLLPQSTLKNCIEIGMANGKYVDEADARAACGFGGEAESTVDNANPTQAAQQPLNRNLAWEALQKNALFQNDHQLAEMMMTLIGTISVWDDNGTPQEIVVPGHGADDSMITALLDGSAAVKVHQCQDTACLNFVPNGDTISVTGFKTTIDTMVTDMVTKIQTKQALTSQEIALLGMSTIPLYKIASVQVAANGALAANEMQQYDDAIAADVLIGWMQENIMQVQTTAMNVQGISAPDMATWQGNVRQVMQRLDAKRQANYEKMSAMDSLISRTKEVEKDLAAMTGSRFAQALAYQNTRKAG